MKSKCHKSQICWKNDSLGTFKLNSVGCHLIVVPHVSCNCVFAKMSNTGSLQRLHKCSGYRQDGLHILWDFIFKGVKILKILKKKPYPSSVFSAQQKQPTIYKRKNSYSFHLRLRFSVIFGSSFSLLHISHHTAHQ